MRRAILLLCDWRSLPPADIAHYLDWDRDRLRQTYIKALLDERLLDVIGGRFNPGLTYQTTDTGREWVRANQD